jgi:predicted MFS family arabinose efflux permease
LVALPDRGATPAVLGALALGVALMAGFVAVEHRRGARAMVPLALFRGSAFAGLQAFTLFLYAALGGLLLLLPYALIRELGWSATAAGAAMLPLPLLIGILSRSAGGALTDRFGTRTMLAAGAGLVAAGFGLFTRIPPTDVGYVADILPGLVVLALGMSLAVAPLTTAMLAAAGPDRSGVASGINNAVSRIGGLVATALLGLVLLGGDLLTGLAAAAWVGAALAGLAAALALATVREGP